MAIYQVHLSPFRASSSFAPLRRDGVLQVEYMHLRRPQPIKQEPCESRNGEKELQTWMLLVVMRVFGAYILHLIIKFGFCDRYD